MKSPPPAARDAFSLIETLVAVALAAGVITTAVLGFQAFTANGGPRATYGTITVGGTLINGVFFAPSYGRAAQAETLRTQFLADLQGAIAVYCLGRNTPNTFHPTTITVAANFRGDSLGLPDDFLSLVAPLSATTFISYRGASTATNVSVFILGPSTFDPAATNLLALAVYDIDLMPTTAGTTPAGTYASVKRFAAGTLTDYYDVFYPAPLAASGRTRAFKPVVASFERAGLPGADTRFSQALERPFYFLWWPDPAEPWLESDFAPAYAANDPRAAYAAMGGRTSFFFVVPMFPAL